MNVVGKYVVGFILISVVEIKLMLVCFCFIYGLYVIDEQETLLVSTFGWSDDWEEHLEADIFFNTGRTSLMCDLVFYILIK